MCDGLQYLSDITTWHHNGMGVTCSHKEKQVEFFRPEIEAGLSNRFMAVAHVNLERPYAECRYLYSVSHNGTLNY